MSVAREVWCCHAGDVGYADDVEVVREYVRTTGRFDYLRMREIAADCVAVEFAFNVERHAAALTASVTESSHIRVLAGPKRPDHLNELCLQYWEPLREAVFAVCETLPALHEVTFGYNEEGPFLAVGLSPFTDDERTRVTLAFKPHIVRTFHQEAVTPI
jgi:hypothetical protein